MEPRPLITTRKRQRDLALGRGDDESVASSLRSRASVSISMKRDNTSSRGGERDLNIRLIEQESVVKVACDQIEGVERGGE